MKFDEGDAHDYVVAGIVDSAVFDDDDGNAGGLYYLVRWKNAPTQKTRGSPTRGCLIYEGCWESFIRIILTNPQQNR